MCTHERIHSDSGQYGHAEGDNKDRSLPQHGSDDWQSVQDRHERRDECDCQHGNDDESEGKHFRSSRANGHGHHREYESDHTDVRGGLGVPTGIAEPMAASDGEPVETLKDEVRQILDGKGGIALYELRWISPWDGPLRSRSDLKTGQKKWSPESDSTQNAARKVEYGTADGPRATQPREPLDEQSDEEEEEPEANKGEDFRLPGIDHCGDDQGQQGDCAEAMLTADHKKSRCEQPPRPRQYGSVRPAQPSEHRATQFEHRAGEDACHRTETQDPAEGVHARACDHQGHNHLDRKREM
jgi:hypothetical protein